MRLSEQIAPCTMYEYSSTKWGKACNTEISFHIIPAKLFSLRQVDIQSAQVKSYLDGPLLLPLYIHGLKIVDGWQELTGKNQGENGSADDRLG